MMPGRYDDDERDEATDPEDWDAADDDEEERDLPQDRDLDPDESEDDLATASCPYCGQEIIHDVAQCPSCGQYVAQQSAPGKNPPWLAAITLLLVVALAAWLMR